MGRTETGLLVIISFFALIISVLSFYFSIKTSFLQYRPYVGIIETPIRIVPDSSTKGRRRMRWEIVFKNTGSIPAWMKVEKRECSIIFDKESISCTGRKVPASGIFLMSQGTGALSGDLPDPVTVTGKGLPTAEISLDKVLSGKSVLIEHVRVSYQPSAALSQGWLSRILRWTNKYQYEVELNLATSLSPSSKPYFYATVIKAD